MAKQIKSESPKSKPGTARVRFLVTVDSDGKYVVFGEDNMPRPEVEADYSGWSDGTESSFWCEMDVPIPLKGKKPPAVLLKLPEGQP